VELCEAEFMRGRLKNEKEHRETAASEPAPIDMEEGC
jgi:hypothetical protein